MERGANSSTNTSLLEELQQIAAREDLTKDEEFILEEMKLWFEGVTPDSY